MNIDRPTPELPVPDVEAAQHYYRDRLGFEIAWYNREGGIGAVANGDCAIFFRQTDRQVHPATFWIFCIDVEGTHDELTQLGANIVDPIADKPWGLRQFTVEDLHGNRFHFHHDLEGNEVAGGRA